jgi:hypothetical protein
MTTGPQAGKERSDKRTTLWEGKEWQQNHSLGRRGIEIRQCSGKKRNDNRTTFWEG